MLRELNERSESILRYIVDAYMATGEPVGSRIISEKLGLNLSPATIRNVMAELEGAGLLSSPHTSAGRLPTQAGMRLYVDGLMQIGDLSEEERAQIKAHCQTSGQSMTQVMESATSMLSGLSSAAGLVIAPKTNKPVKQIQFIQLDPHRILIVMVMQDGLVENRVMEVAQPVPPHALIMASNYINDRLAGRTLKDAQVTIADEIASRRAQIDEITADLVQKGIALDPNDKVDSHIIVRGQSRLLDDVKAIEDLERARKLLSALEDQQTISKLLNAAQGADGVQIFIGTENRMFEHSGWSMVISPYKSQESQIIGAIGVIGPVRLNYSRIIPLLDYTSKIMERIINT